ncbi:nucleotide-binding protein [Actinomyces bowdenii]|uniref:Nucleotide-binding protein n=2 Tax=Actinomyces bowdenii TaxID=131109 RepID=A0A853EM96_9ACTO|nr:nucleotide-binding protein [Actinomyces bowdenii]NYS70437.1 nucleotide-binding protein [Actinomyces bowdenii]
MTGDDRGALASDVDNLQPRARQNVVFELGYCIAKLGKKNVAVIYEDNVEIPSDFLGYGYTKLSEDWKTPLTRELLAAGIPVDRNKEE